MNIDDRSALWTWQVQRLRRKIRDRDGDQCGICGLVMFFAPRHLDRSDLRGIAASLDHITPLCRGGTHSADNLRLAHRFCNSYRGDRKAREHTVTPQTRKYAQRVLMPLVQIGLITHLYALEVSPSAYGRVSARQTALKPGFGPSSGLQTPHYDLQYLRAAMPAGVAR